MFIDIFMIRKEDDQKLWREVEIKGKEIYEKNIKNIYIKKK